MRDGEGPRLESRGREPFVLILDCMKLEAGDNGGTPEQDGDNGGPPNSVVKPLHFNGVKYPFSPLTPP